MNSRRIRISLRILMLLILITAVWMGRQVNKAREQREALRAVKTYGGWVHYDWELVNGKLIPGGSPPGPAWLRWLLGDEYFQDIAMVSLIYDDSSGKRYDNANVQPCDLVLARLEPLAGLRCLLLKGTQATNTGLKSLANMTRLEELFIRDATNVDDAGIAHLKGLRRLKRIHINNSKMSDAGLGYLSRLPELEWMSLQGNHFSDAGLARLKHIAKLKILCVGLGHGTITDAGLVHLSGLTNLELLDIQRTDITDRGLEHLKRLTHLKEMWTSGSRITKEGAERFKKAMPSLQSVLSG